MLRLASLLALSLTTLACVTPALQGGSNGNDRSDGGEQGEALFNGAMAVSPDGKFALMQRRASSVLLDLEAHTAREMPAQVARILFAPSASLGVAVQEPGSDSTDRRSDVVAYDLPSTKERWRQKLSFASAGGLVQLAKMSEDLQHLIVSDGRELLVLDAHDGRQRGAIELETFVHEFAFVPGADRALIVGSTEWTDHKPLTAVIELDLTKLSMRRIDIPNCTAPIVVLPDASRALLSPTFCEEGVSSSNKQEWANPDPVSVIDLGADGPRFLKNLPGFGPVALAPEADRAVAYLDLQRLDASMFDDASKIPPTDGARYHIMTIDPRSLAYELSPIGNALPRFAMARSGQALMVDTTVQQERGGTLVKVSVDLSGKVETSGALFGQKASLFGVFDLNAGSYAPFEGSAASLDRFVQLADQNTVYGLSLSTDGSGGDLFRIDLAAHQVTQLGLSLRDIGLLPDGSTLLLRQRLSPLEVPGGRHLRERYCASIDGLVCVWSVDFQDSVLTPAGSGLE